MFIIAAGDCGNGALADQASDSPGNGIEIKKGQFQGGLIARKNIERPIPAPMVQGPMVSVYGSVCAGQGGRAELPAISFPTSGSSGFTRTAAGAQAAAAPQLRRRLAVSTPLNSRRRCCR